MPLTAEQSWRRALYVTPAQPAPTKQLVPVAKRPRPPQDRETATFVQRELQAVLLTEDVGIIVQHVTGVLLNLAKRHAPKPSPSTPRTAGGSTYGDKAGFLAAVAASMAGFLVEDQAAQFAEQLWCFLHSGLTVAAYDRLVFAYAAREEGEEGRGEQEEEQDQGGGRQMEAEATGALRDW